MRLFRLPRLLACLCVLMSVLACSDEGDGEQTVSLIFSISGLGDGVVTLTEAKTGTTWRFVGTGGYYESHALPFVTSESTYEIRLSVESPQHMECPYADGLTGDVPDQNDESLYDWEKTIRVRELCRRPLDTLTFADPALQACIDELSSLHSYTWDYEFRELDCSERGISDLTGLSVLYDVEHLILRDNQLTSFDRAEFPEVQTIDVSFNMLTSLDLGGSTGQQPISLYYPSELDASFNQITSVTGFEGTQLSFLDLGFNELDALDIPGIVPPPLPGLATSNPSINRLDVRFNRLTFLDVDALGFSLNLLNVDGNRLPSLSVEFNEFLFELRAAHNGLSGVLDLKGGRYFDEFLPGVGLNSLDVSGNALTEIPAGMVSPTLVELWADDNDLSIVDLSRAEDLATLSLAGNLLPAIDLAPPIALVDVDLSDNLLVDFDWAFETLGLGLLDLSENSIDTIAPCDAPNLQSFDASHNSIASFDISGCPEITDLRLRDNALTALDVLSNPDLEHVDLLENPLTCPAVIDLNANLVGVDLLVDPNVCLP